MAASTPRGGLLQHYFERGSDTDSDSVHLVTPDEEAEEDEKQEKAEQRTKSWKIKWSRMKSRMMKHPNV